MEIINMKCTHKSRPNSKLNITAAKFSQNKHYHKLAVYNNGIFNTINYRKITYLYMNHVNCLHKYVMVLKYKMFTSVLQIYKDKKCA